VVILVDTLRPDRLGAYAPGSALTPFVDSLAARAVVFRQAYAQAPWTNPSVASLFTSRYQSQHGIETFASVLGEQEVTLAEVLRQHGYATAAFVANYLLPSKSGYAQGFDAYHTLAAGRQGQEHFDKARAARVNQEGLAWLDKRARTDQPFFLYLHYMEPHNPYGPEPQYLDHVLGGRPRPDQVAVNARMNMPNVGVFSDEMVQAVRDYYDAEVMSLDAQLRALFAELTARQLLDNTIVVLLADHGEEFREHGLMGHGQTLFEEVIHVPLLIVTPGRSQHLDVAPPVSVIDVAPTLLDLAGLAVPVSFEGHSLRPLMGLPPRAWGLAGCGSTGAPPPPVIFSELIKGDLERLAVHEHAVRDADGKLIVGVHGEREFYDLRTDPGELHPTGLGAEQRAALDAQLSRFNTQFARGSAPAATRALDADTRERMRVLGYDEKH
jgi:arylsulfatase A-like enzyme